MIVGLVRARGRGGRRVGDPDGGRGDGLLRHRHAGDAGEAGARRLRVPDAGADPALRPLPLVHRRPDAQAAGASLRLAHGAAALLLVRPRAYFPEEVEPRWDLGYMGTYSDDRQPTLDRLLPSRRAAGARAASWSPGRSTRRRSAGRATSSASSTWRRASTARFYNQQRFTLNVTRADMIAAGWSPSVRLFEAAACGTPIISDAWAGLESLLRDRRGDPDCPPTQRGPAVPAGRAGAGAPGPRRARARPGDGRAHRRAPRRGARDPRPLPAGPQGRLKDRKWQALPSPKSPEGATA